MEEMNMCNKCGGTKFSYRGLKNGDVINVNNPEDMKKITCKKCNFTMQDKSDMASARRCRECWTFKEELTNFNENDDICFDCIRLIRKELTELEIYELIQKIIKNELTNDKYHYLIDGKIFHACTLPCKNCKFYQTLECRNVSCLSDTLYTFKKIINAKKIEVEE